MDMDTFFNSWAGLVRVAIVGTLAYTALVLVLRVSGKRTLSKMNAFDLVVTVALGSTLATIILSSDVALAEGVLGFALLIGLQYAVTWSSVRSRAVSRFVKSDPALLYYRGRYLHQQMRQSRVVEAEVSAAVREQGIASMGDVEAVVLETDGTFAVVSPSEAKPTALNSVKGVPRT